VTAAEPTAVTGDATCAMPRSLDFCNLTLKPFGLILGIVSCGAANPAERQKRLTNGQQGTAQLISPFIGRCVTSFGYGNSKPRTNAASDKGANSFQWAVREAVRTRNTHLSTVKECLMFNSCNYPHICQTPKSTDKKPRKPSHGPAASWSCYYHPKTSIYSITLAQVATEAGLRS
jgi:hypothetical protein